MSASYEIFTAHHKKDELIDIFSKYFYPIQVGSSAAQFDLGIERDDSTEINISIKNPNYCELTATYCISQRKLPEYVGLMHYRRMFVIERRLNTLLSNINYLRRVALYRLGRKKRNPQRSVGIDLDGVGAAKEESNKLKKFLDKELHKYDIILPKRVIVYGCSVRETYARAHYAKDFDRFFATMLRLFPAYEPSIQSALVSGHYYKYNMFIMRRDIFENYARTLFAILFELEGEIDLMSYDDYQKRVFGFLAERFMAVFVDRLVAEDGLRLLELPVARYAPPLAG